MSSNSDRPDSQRVPADHSAAVRITMLVVGTVLAATAVKGLGWLVGARGEWVGVADRNLIQFFFLGGTVFLMALQNLSPGALGLRIEKHWGRSLLLGLTLAALLLVGYYVFAAAADVLVIRTDRVLQPILRTIKQLLRAGMRSSMAQVIACGYVLALLKQRHGTPIAVIATALLFALFFDPFEIPAILGGAQTSYFVGVVLGMILLCLLRLAAGSLLPGIGALTAWLYVQDAIRRGRLLGPGEGADPTWVAWLAPQQEILRAPAFWGLLLLGILGLAAWLRRHGEPAAASEATGMSTSFKRVYPFAQPNAFAPLDLWIARLTQARFRVGLVYIPRLLCTLCLSTINTVLSLPERLLLPLFLPLRRVPDPVFVVGVHRSGTTHLHNLLSLDPELISPRLYQVSNPLGFVFSGWLVVPIMACAPSKRPMDNMSMHVFAPSEDEFAQANATKLSPYWGPVFTREVAYYDGFIHPEDWTERERLRWKRVYLAFCRRLVLFSRKRPLFKNPFNTARVGLLHGLFPGARFVHIIRHPRDVYRSNMRLTDQGFLLFQLQDPDERDSFKTRFCRKYRRMEDAFYRDAAALPPEQVAEVRFEDLERDPVAAIEAIYAQWGRTISPAYRARLEQYLLTIRGYKKNVHEPLEPAAARELRESLTPLLERWGYTLPEADSTEADSTEAGEAVAEEAP